MIVKADYAEKNKYSYVLSLGVNQCRVLQICPLKMEKQHSYIMEAIKPNTKL